MTLTDFQHEINYHVTHLRRIKDSLDAALAAAEPDTQASGPTAEVRALETMADAVGDAAAVLWQVVEDVRLILNEGDEPKFRIAE